MPAVHLVDVEPADPRLLSDVLPVLVELRPHLTAESVATIYAEAHPQGLRFLAAYDGDRCLGVAGWRLVTTTHTGRKLYVDDLVTTASARSRGVGHALLTELAQRGTRPGAQCSTSTAACTAETRIGSTSGKGCTSRATTSRGSSTNQRRSSAPVRRAASATAAPRAALASSAVSVRSGARNRNANASDLLVAPTCGPS